MVFQALLSVSLLSIGTARAQGNGASYVTPFPKDDVYVVRLYGDYYADGLSNGLRESIKRDKRLRLDKSYRRIRAIVRADFSATLKEFEKDLTNEPVPIAVVMTGGDDQGRIRYANGARVRFGTSAWRRAYGGRVDKLVRLFRDRGIALYWVGLPIMRREKANIRAKIINDIVRERLYLNGAKFIDIYNAFVNENGEYDRFGPDLSGKIRKLRNRDGETFTAAGNRKVAHFVLREIRRDLVQARALRAIPLAGNEEEQRRINPVRSADNTDAGGWTGAVVKHGKNAGNTKRRRRKRSANRGLREQKADNSRIRIKSVGPDGKVKTVSVEIVRPAISAAVIALVTRKQSSQKAARIGDSVPGILRGGLTILSSITPGPSIGAGQIRRQLPPTHTSYYRALIKGERLPPKPGRADDFRWPRLDALMEGRNGDRPARAQAPADKMDRPQG